MKPNEDKSLELWQAVHAVRMLIFIEDEPQSNKYRQVILNPAQFKHMSFSLSNILSKPVNNFPHFAQPEEVKMSDIVYPLPDIQEIYEK